MAVRTLSRKPLASGKTPQPLVFAANLASIYFDAISLTSEEAL